LLKKKGLDPREPEFYEGKLWRKYDIEMFIQYLEEGREEVENARFYDKLRSKCVLLIFRGRRRVAIQRLSCRHARDMEEMGDQINEF